MQVLKKPGQEHSSSAPQASALHSPIHQAPVPHRPIRQSSMPCKEKRPRAIITTLQPNGEIENNTSPKKLKRCDAMGFKKFKQTSLLDRWAIDSASNQKSTSYGEAGS